MRVNTGYINFTKDTSSKKDAPNPCKWGKSHYQKATTLWSCSPSLIITIMFQISCSARVMITTDKSLSRDHHYLSLSLYYHVNYSSSSLIYHYFIHSSLYRHVTIVFITKNGHFKYTIILFTTATSFLSILSLSCSQLLIITIKSKSRSSSLIITIDLTLSYVADWA